MRGRQRLSRTLVHKACFFDDSDAHLTTVAVSFDEAELAPLIINELRQYTLVMYDPNSDRRPASDVTARFTIFPTGKRVKIDIG